MKKKPEVKTFVFNPFQENTYVLYEPEGACVIIDPGCSTPEEEEEIHAFILKRHLQPAHVLLTHGHLDHVCGAPFFYNEFGLSPELHPDDLPLYQTVKEQAELFSFPVAGMPPANKLESGPVTFGKTKLEIIHLPGHTPGGVGFYNREYGFLFSGDILFRGSIGRTDLPGGDYALLKNSIKKEILDNLGEEVRVFPGHGPDTTVGYEALSNPFLDFV